MEEAIVTKPRWTKQLLQKHNEQRSRARTERHVERDSPAEAAAMRDWNERLPKTESASQPNAAEWHWNAGHLTQPRPLLSAVRRWDRLARTEKLVETAPSPLRVVSQRKDGPLQPAD